MPDFRSNSPDPGMNAAGCSRFPLRLAYRAKHTQQPDNLERSFGSQLVKPLDYTLDRIASGTQVD